MKLSSITEVYEQDEDSAGRANESRQDITLETVDAGGGSYIVIKTERWALDDAADMAKLVGKMKAMLKRIEA